ncbi:Membrane-anchored junction protein [Trichinella pseudospiralis]
MWVNRRTKIPLSKEQKINKKTAKECKRNFNIFLRTTESNQQISVPNHCIIKKQDAAIFGSCSASTA